MATSKITVIGLVGILAGDLIGRLQLLRDQAEAGDSRQVDDILSQLKDLLGVPNILWFSEYIDAWSMPGILLENVLGIKFGSPDSLIHFGFDAYQDIVCLDRQVSFRVKKSLSKNLCSIDSIHEKFFAQNIYSAISVIEEWNPFGVVICIKRIGETLSRKDVLENLEKRGGES